MRYKKISMHYCVVGGGLSGLSTAFYLKHLLPLNTRITVIEASERCGGWIRSLRYEDGSVFELGPRSARFHAPTAPYLLHLVEQLDLTNKVIPISAKAPAANRRFMYVKDRLCELKPGSVTACFPFTRPIWRDVLRCFMSRHDKLPDMTVDHFFRTRLGDDVADYLINPMIRGIYAGDSRQLGMDATFPDFLRYDKMAPNFILGFLYSKYFSGKKPEALPFDSTFYNEAVKSGWMIWSLEGGMQTLIDRLVESLKVSGVQILTDSPTRSIKMSDGRLQVNSRNKSDMVADHVFLTTPAHVTARLLSGCDPVPRLLEQIPFVDVAVVVLEFEGNINPVEGFGHLIPSSEIPHVLGFVYDSCVFPNASLERTRFTCMLGGAWWDDHCAQLTESDLLTLASDTLRDHLGIAEKPFRSFVAVHRQCIAQYGVGHRALVTKCREELLSAKLPVHLVGSSYDGISVNDCAASSYAAVNKVVQGTVELR